MRLNLIGYYAAWGYRLNLLVGFGVLEQTNLETEIVLSFGIMDQMQRFSALDLRVCVCLRALIAIQGHKTLSS